MITDAHHHLWQIGREAYSWIRPEHGVLYRDWKPEDLQPLLAANGVANTVCVQASDSEEDTELMLAAADSTDWIAAVVGWAPLEDPDAADRVLDRFCRDPRFCGVRHLVQREPDPDWLLRPPVQRSLGLLEARGLVYEIPAEYPRHLRHVPAVASRHPELRIVVDHLAKPPLGDGDLSGWMAELEAASQAPNVWAKVSGLNTSVRRGSWQPQDLKPAVEHALACFGPHRLMWGSDWPVCLLAGDYRGYLQASKSLLAHLDPPDEEAVLGGNARRLYGIGAPE